MSKITPKTDSTTIPFFHMPHRHTLTMSHHAPAPLGKKNSSPSLDLLLFHPSVAVSGSCQILASTDLFIRMSLSLQRGTGDERLFYLDPQLDANSKKIL